MLSKANICSMTCGHIASHCVAGTGLRRDCRASDTESRFRKCKLLIEQPDVCLVYSQQHFTQDN